jgi:hypothetical protein
MIRTWLALLVLAPGGVWGQDPADALQELQNLARVAFRPLPVTGAAKLAKEIEPDLPQGIVTEAGPFDQLVARRVGRHAEQLALREQVVMGLVACPGPKAGKVLRDAIRLLVKECQELERHIVVAEGQYAAVWDADYMTASQSERTARKTAAVLIPYYRELMMRDAALVERTATPLAALRTGDALAWLERAAASDSEPHVRAMAAEALGRIGGEGPREVLAERVRKDGDSLVRRRALAALMRYPLREVQSEVLAALEDEAWEVRALAIRCCVQGQLLAAVGPLVAAAGRETGRLRQDVDDALFTLVGTRMYGDGDLWQNWWEQEGAAIATRAQAQLEAGELDRALGLIQSWERSGAAAAERASPAEPAMHVTSSFYGIPTFSDRVIFIIDLSRSMRDAAGSRPPSQGGRKDPYAEPEGASKEDIARWQLHRAVADLPRQASGNLIVYSESYRSWQPYMTSLRGRGRRQLHGFIDELGANGVTNLGDSLERALASAGAGPLGAGAGRADELPADTIYLLSDGDPNRGRVAALPALLESVVRQNLYAGIVIHTIGIGEAAGSTFLRDLARHTGGEYVEFR